MLIDPEDDFWNETERTVQQIRPVEKGEYKGDDAYKTPIKVKGKMYYRRKTTVTSDRPPTRLADVYASWATSDHNASGGRPGPNTGAVFLSAVQRVQQGSRADPQFDAHG